MRQQDWPVEHLDMVRHFWLALEGHSWRHDPSKYCKCALLLYQGRVRRDWHKTLGTPDAFCLLPLQVGRLNNYHQELLDNAYTAKIEAMRTVCNFLANLTTHLTWHNHYLSPATPPSPSITSLHFHPIPMPHAGAHPMQATIRTRDQPHSSVLVSHTAKTVFFPSHCGAILTTAYVPDLISSDVTTIPWRVAIPPKPSFVGLKQRHFHKCLGDRLVTLGQ
jgi:hypothetical protein